jgi:hypothetical protein
MLTIVVSGGPTVILNGRALKKCQASAYIQGSFVKEAWKM